MSPATYNLFESLVRSINTLCRLCADEKTSESIRDEVHGKLMALKQSMSRDAQEDPTQPMARLLVAMARSSLGFSVREETTDISKKELLRLTREVEQRAKDRAEVGEKTLHPTGQCTCEGQLTNGQPEGECEWCQSHCIECGMALEDDKCPNCYPAGKALAEEIVDPRDEPCPKCGEAVMYCECGRQSAIDRNVDCCAKYNALVALYGHEEPLCQEQLEELEIVIKPIIRRWGR